MKHSLYRLTGIKPEKLGDMSILDALKDPDSLDITNIQREKLNHLKELFKISLEEEKPEIISSSSDVFSNFKSLILNDVEEFYVLLLKRNNSIIDKVKISKGGVSGTVVDVKVIAQKAISRKANSVILVHNHPSGNLKPSEADIKLTNKTKDGLKLLDVSVLDHLIIANNNFYSFADEGII